MTTALDTLVNLLDLEPLEVNIYRGRNRDLGTGRVYGGQVFAQALVAARRTGVLTPGSRKRNETII